MRVKIPPLNILNKNLICVFGKKLILKMLKFKDTSVFIFRHYIIYWWLLSNN